jgi:hypothetical protein
VPLAWPAPTAGSGDERNEPQAKSCQATSRFPVVAPARRLDLAASGVDDVDHPLTIIVPSAHDPHAVGGLPWQDEAGHRKPRLTTAVGLHHVHLVGAGALADERDPAPVWGPPQGASDEGRLAAL